MGQLISADTTKHPENRKILIIKQTNIIGPTSLLPEPGIKKEENRSFWIAKIVIILFILTMFNLFQFKEK